MELHVVGVRLLVILYAVVSDDVGDWAAVDCKQQKAKHRPLRDAHARRLQWRVIRAGPS